MTNLIRLLNELSPWLVAFLTVAVAEVYSIGLMLLCRRRWGISLLSLNNEVAGFKFAVVGVLYAVLLAFVVIAVWEDCRDTETAVRNEAKAVIDLDQLAYVLPEPGGSLIHRHLHSYAKKVRESEWPAMAQGQASPAVASDLDHLRRAIFEGSPEGLKDLALYQHALRLLTVIADNRDERLDSSDGSVPPVLWLVLLAGGLIVLGYPAFFWDVESCGADPHDRDACCLGGPDLLCWLGARLPLHRAREHFPCPVRSRLGTDAATAGTLALSAGNPRRERDVVVKRGYSAASSFMR